MRSSISRSAGWTPLLAALLLLCASNTYAAWPTSPSTNLPVATEPHKELIATSVSDEAGGAIFVWTAGGDDSIYAQRFDSNGNALWQPGGVLLSDRSSAPDENNIHGVPDGSGGVIIAWEDWRGVDKDIYAQRVDGSGAVLWATNGLGVTSGADHQIDPILVSDGSGGAIITWEDERTSTASDIYAQRVDASGAILWPVNGVAICTATGTQGRVQIAEDGSGGAIIAWSDDRSGVDDDIYAQHVDASGFSQWALNGIEVCGATGDQWLESMTTDGDGGALLAWRDRRSGVRIPYMGRIHEGSTPLGDGDPISDLAGGVSLVAVPDGAGGAYFGWIQNDSVFVQRMRSDGFRLWGTSGLHFGGMGTVDDLALIGGPFGLIGAWSVVRSGSYPEGLDIYAQFLSPAGAKLWDESGVAISTAPQPQETPTIVTDGADGAIIAWSDLRSAVNDDVYAQNVDRYGKLGDAAPAIVSVSDVPNDQGGQVLVEWTRSYLDAFPQNEVDAYSIWRRAPSQAAVAEARRSAQPYRVTYEQGLAIYWEHLETKPALGRPGYSYVAATTSDSIAGSNPLTSFQIVAEDNGGAQYWLSAPDSGYSVDDLAPAAPMPFAGTYDSGVTTMSWGTNGETDFAVYRLYRGSDLGFVPSPGNLVAELTATDYADNGGQPFVYKLSAVDVHGNESAATTLVADGTVSIGQPGAVAFALSPPAPNPVRGLAGTTLRFGLAVAGRVRLDVHDVHGRLVRSLVGGVLNAGEHTMRFDGRDRGGRPLAPGIYLARLAQGERLAMRRVLIIP